MSILLVDLSSIFWQMWHATGDNEVGNAFDGTVKKITVAAGANPTGGVYDHVGICIDSPPYTRKEIYPEYKEQRDKPSEVAIGQLERVKRRLELDGFPLFVVPGAEADDVIAALVLHASYSDHPVDILTGDKDLFQLVNDMVNVISTQTGLIIDPPAVHEKTGVDASCMAGWLALVGDKSDNVPGVPGVGKVTAAKLLDTFGGDIEQVKIAAATKDPDGLLLSAVGANTRDKLIKHADDIIMSHSLVTLNADLDIDPAPLYAEREPQPLDSVSGVDTIEEPTVEPVTVLARRDVDYTRQLEPVSVDGAWKLARCLEESRLYTKFRSREAITAVILRGRELGIGATTSLDAFDVIQGRPTMSADLIVGLVLQSPVCEYFTLVESTDEHATYETKRTGSPNPVVHTFTIKDAERMGLTSKDNWHKMPATMLRHRCGVALGRIAYPDITVGLYTPEEIEVIR